MINSFLLNEAIQMKDFELFMNGMSELIAIKMEKGDSFFKHKSIYNLDILNTLYSDYGPVQQQIIKFIEQLSPVDEYIPDEDTFEDLHINGLNGFIGIDFSITEIKEEKQITDQITFDVFKKDSYLCLRTNGDKDQLAIVLDYLYPNYEFDNRAFDDITFWNEQNFDLYTRLHTLLEDVEINPFKGGLGKTEVLKNQKGVASKRLDGEHRITYSLKNDEIIILACRGHYT